MPTFLAGLVFTLSMVVIANAQPAIVDVVNAASRIPAAQTARFPLPTPMAWLA